MRHFMHRLLHNATFHNGSFYFIMQHFIMAHLFHHATFHNGSFYFTMQHFIMAHLFHNATFHNELLICQSTRMGRGQSWSLVVPCLDRSNSADTVDQICSGHLARGFTHLSRCKETSWVTNCVTLIILSVIAECI